jgi:RNA polymerase sigma-70 factor (ECF subfamily)
MADEVVVYTVRREPQVDGVHMVLKVTGEEAAATQALQMGDIAGLEALVRLHQRQALKVALHITANRAMAEDVVADAFVTVFDRIGQFDPRRPFAPWFYRIVVNAALKAVSRQAMQLPGSEALLAVQSHPTSPEQDAIRHEERDAVIASIQRLPAKQRAVVTLRYYLDMDETTIGKTMGIPTGTVKWRLHAARRKLRSALGASTATPTKYVEAGER